MPFQASLQASGGGLDETTILKWATALGLALACNDVESSQVQKLLEIATNYDEPFSVLQAFVLYQTARDTWKKHAARLFVEAIHWLKERKATVNDLQNALGYVKWVHRAIENLKKKVERERVCNENNKKWINFETLVSQTDPDKLFLSIVKSYKFNE